MKTWLRAREIWFRHSKKYIGWNLVYSFIRDLLSTFYVLDIQW